MPLQSDLNRLAGTTGLDAQGAANKWAGTTALDLLGALNAKNGTAGWGLNRVLNALAGTSGLDSHGAAALISGFPLAATLTDNFATQDTTKWTFAAGAAVSGGTLVVNATPAYPAAVSKNSYSLIGSQAMVSMLGVPNNTGSTEASLLVWATQLAGTNQVRLLVANNYIMGQYRVGADASWTSLTGITYSATSHKVLRIREQGGQLYFEGSPDGTTWTGIASMATPFSVAGVVIALQAGNWNNDVGPGSATFDDFNIVPAAQTQQAYGASTYGTGLYG